jgi:Protein of unknown function (DUF2867)
MKKLAIPPQDSLLLTQLNEFDIHHQDTFELVLRSPHFAKHSATDLLLALLTEFTSHPPRSVTLLMEFRNVLVKPFGLRTSKLGCPVSSLISADDRQLFQGRFPVLAQRINEDERSAQVILGANDKHLMFRSCVGVKRIDSEAVCVSLGTRVHCKNRFGRFYMAAIDLVHRHYISPLMLNFASAALLKNIETAPAK